MFNLMIRETGDCYDGDPRLLHLELRDSRVGARELELVDREQNRRIKHQFGDEAAARKAAEIAYAYGRRFGSWKVQRAVGYRPEGSPVSTVR